MKKSKLGETERLAILAKQDSGTGIDDLCREYQMVMLPETDTNKMK